MAGSPLLGCPFTAEPSAPGTRSAPRSPPRCRFAAAGRVNAQNPLPRISSGSLLPSCGLRSPSGSYPVRIKAPCRHRLEDLTVASGPLSLRSPATAAVYDHRLPDHRSRLATVCSARCSVSLPAPGISPLALQCSALRLLACRCEARTSKRTFTRPQRRACCQITAAGSEFLPCLFSSTVHSPLARSALVSIPGLSREPPGTSTTRTRCFQILHRSCLPR
jgi:hypothetical protein